MKKFPPFDAYFQYSFNGPVDKIFKEHIDIFLSRVSDANGIIKTKTFLHTYLTGSDLPIFKKSLPIPFDLYSVHSISPETFKKDAFKSRVSFKINSNIVKVVQIDGKHITFEKSDNEVLTVTMSDDIQLFRVTGAGAIT